MLSIYYHWRYGLPPHWAYCANVAPVYKVVKVEVTLDVNGHDGRVVAEVVVVIPSADPVEAEVLAVKIVVTVDPVKAIVFTVETDVPVPAIAETVETVVFAVKIVVTVDPVKAIVFTVETDVPVPAIAETVETVVFAVKIVVTVDPVEAIVFTVETDAPVPTVAETVKTVVLEVESDATEDIIVFIKPVEEVVFDKELLFVNFKPTTNPAVNPTPTTPSEVIKPKSKITIFFLFEPFWLPGSFSKAFLIIEFFDCALKGVGLSLSAVKVFFSTLR